MTTAFPGYKPTPELESETEYDNVSYHVPSTYKQKYNNVVPKTLTPKKLEVQKLSMPIIEVQPRPVMPVYRAPVHIPQKQQPVFYAPPLPPVPQPVPVPVVETA